MEKLIDIIHNPPEDWDEQNLTAFEELFGAPNGHYPNNAKLSVKLRAPKIPSDKGVKFSAFIHSSNPDSGPYGGMSFCIFPPTEGPCLVTFVVGTQGLNPDEQILSRPGHSRKISAICEWINKEFGKGNMVAWSKQDPTRIDIKIPENVTRTFQNYQSVFDRYGKELYAIYKPSNDKEETKQVIQAFIDVMFEERGYSPLKAHQQESNRIKNKYLRSILPSLSTDSIESILEDRRYVILEGPPGTGKTYQALKILKGKYKGNGTSIQFHPNTTYENFIGGLSPVRSNTGMGFSFEPKNGFLMDAVNRANENPHMPYLLHIDEINRADLSKVLGEAIFLFETLDEGNREIDLPYNFSEPINNKLKLPTNLHILGTMNSSDRSIAILDIAIRRRFAFIKLWPQYEIVDKLVCNIMKQAFQELMMIFIEFASDSALTLMPGHAYFLEKDEKKAKEILKINLYPLLEEYLAQGYVSGFSEHIKAYMQWLLAL